METLTARFVATVSACFIGVLMVLLVMVWLGESAAKRNLGAMTADRNGLVTWGEKVCGTVGEPFKNGKRPEWGQTCFARIVTLQAFRTSATDQTNTALVGHLKTQLAKKDADLARAQRDKALAFEALDALAKEAAHVPETNEVGPAYYRALNRTAGLRDADAAQAR